MSAEKILSQDEIDALIHGIDVGTVETEPEPEPGVPRHYDFQNQARIVRGRLPTLEMINERFARLFRQDLYNLLRRIPEISVGQIKMKKFSEYVHSLHVPTNLNIVKISPLRGTALMVLSPKLVFSVVDNFFGGHGRHAKIEGRDFTAMEQRVIHMLLKCAFADLKEAWSHTFDIDIEHLQSELNPHFANIVGPSEIVVVTTFSIDLDGGGGEFHVTMPYSMIEPLRDVLDAGIQSDRVEHDERWLNTMRDEINDAEVVVNTVLGHSSLTVGELLNLRNGDVIPFDFTGTATLTTDSVPMFRGTFGISHGHQAVKITERIRRPGSDTDSGSLKLTPRKAS